MDIFTTWNEMGTAPPVEGDPMTVCDGDLFFVYVTQTKHTGWLGSSRRDLRALMSGCVAFEEGTKWIRGHHTADSEQGAALIAAHALLK